MPTLRKAVDNFRSSFEPDRPVTSGWMIDWEGRGDARVSDDLSKVYVLVDRGEAYTSGDVIKAKWEGRPVPGWPVKVGTTRERYWEYSVLEIDDEAMGGQLGGVSKLQYHHETHEWRASDEGGDDVVYPRWVQLYDFGVWPSSLWTILAQSGVYDPSGTVRAFNQATQDITGSMPESGERYVTVSLTPSGTLEAVAGETKDFVTLYDIPPAASDDHWELAAVRMRAGLSALTHSPDAPNIIDLRFSKIGWHARKSWVRDRISAIALNDLADVNAPSPSDGDYLVYNIGDPTGTWEPTGVTPGGGGATTFLELTDTPASYSGQSGMAPIVNPSEDALVFTDVATQSELDAHEADEDAHHTAFVGLTASGADVDPDANDRINFWGISPLQATFPSASRINIDFIDQSANEVLAGPAAGGDSSPSFRALVDADIPSDIARADETVTLFDGVTVTVGAVARDYTTIQGAIDHFKGGMVIGACIIDVDAGSYDEALDFSDIVIAKGGSLTLQGDTRALAGLSYVDGAALNPAGLTNGGSGTCALASSTTTLSNDTITVTGTTTNPDFDADSWTTGDRILAYDNSGTIAIYTILSVSNNVITLSTAGPALGNDATAICLLPNRSVDRSTAGPCITIDTVRGVQIDGWYLETGTGSNCHGLYVTNGGGALVNNVAVKAEDNGFYAANTYSWISADTGAISSWQCAVGCYPINAATILGTYAMSIGCTTGFTANTFGYFGASLATGVNCTTAFLNSAFSHMYVASCTARQCTTGYYARRGSYTYAAGTNTNNNGNVANYNPATSDTFGNNNAHITWS